MSKTLILGGVRSGKTRLAHRLAMESGLAVTYLATATLGDEEMTRRIAAHRAQRPVDWDLIEEPLCLAESLQGTAAPNRCIVVDCLTLWLTNLVTNPDGSVLARERAALLDVLTDLPGQLIFVANETNLGVIPMGALTRRFCDEAGTLHQELAAVCGQVIMTVAGLPLVLKDPSWRR